MLSVGWEEQCGRRGLPLWDSSASQFIGSCEDFLEAERCKKLFKIRHLLDMFGQLYKGAGTFHSAGQSKEGNLVLALPTIRFSWNFYQIISDDLPFRWAFFYSGVDRSWLGMAQKWSILDQKWPNMAGLSTLQSGPKGPKRDQNGQPKSFWTFGTLLGPSGPFWTISNKNWYFALKHLCRTLFCPFGAKNHFCLKWSNRVQMGPKWSQIVKNT